MDQFVIKFDQRSDHGPLVVGPFPDTHSAEQWVMNREITNASWTVQPLTAPGDDLAPVPPEEAPEG
jgi:hypothetical protein